MGILRSASGLYGIIYGLTPEKRRDRGQLAAFAGLTTPLLFMGMLAKDLEVGTLPAARVGGALVGSMIVNGGLLGSGYLIGKAIRNIAPPEPEDS